MKLQNNAQTEDVFKVPDSPVDFNVWKVDYDFRFHTATNFEKLPLVSSGIVTKTI